MEMDGKFFEILQFGRGLQLGDGEYCLELISRSIPKYYADLLKNAWI